MGEENVIATQQVMRRWKMHRNALLELVNQLPESGAQWRPCNHAMTTLELLYHLAWTPDFFLSAVEGREAAPVPIPNSIAEAKRLLEELTKAHEEAILKQAGSDLLRDITIPILFITEPAIEALNRIASHEAHHKGQLWIYARMLGVEPPFYVDLGVPTEGSLVSLPGHKANATQQVMRRWKMHRNALLNLADKLPESGARYRPWDGGMSTVELLHHLAWTPDFFLAALDAREPNIPPVPSTIADAQALLQRLTKEHEEKIAGLSEQDLSTEATIQAFNISEPVIEILHRFIGHEAHHKGQLMLHARSLGVEPPFYVDLSI